MTANRVDQASLNGALTNHERRIKVLEAVPPPVASGLPPWFSWTPTLSFPATGVGSGTPPTVDVDFAWLMVQTVDGTLYTDGGLPLGQGTMLGQYKLILTSAGSIDGTYNQVPELLADRSSASGAYNSITGDTVNPFHSIGTGWIMQASTGTILAIQLLTSGELLVPNIPDLADLSGAATFKPNNTCRLANANVSPAIPAFPWVWADNDLISVTYQSPIAIDA